MQVYISAQSERSYAIVARTESRHGLYNKIIRLFKISKYFQVQDKKYFQDNMK